MKNRKLIEIAILAICYEELLRHAENRDNPEFWVNEEEHTISVIQNDPKSHQIRYYDLRKKLLGWINQWLNESDIVILYTCRDNGEISLHRPKDFTEDLSMLEDSDIDPLYQILYIAND